MGVVCIMASGIIPKKLKRGDKMAVVAPSTSLAIISQEVRKIATERLNALGLQVILSKHSEESDELDSSSVEARIYDLNNAFTDKDFNGILTAIGGFSANQLLKHIDYGAIKANPKIICGYSDITAIQNAIYSKTQLITYYGPHFSSFGMKKGIDYTIEYFKKCLFSEEPFEVKASPEWSDDPWFLDQEKRKFIKNEGHIVINEGNTEGHIIGGNLNVFNLLKGTEFMPDMRDSVLFIEDDEATNAKLFGRDLQAIVHIPEFEGVKGIVIGRFQKTSNITNAMLKKIITSKKELDHMPIISNVDFGHTTPQITYPIGGKVKLTAKRGNVKLIITEH